MPKQMMAVVDIYIRDGFMVRFRSPDDSDLPSYEGAWRKAAKKTMTVARWKSHRFQPVFGHTEVDVLMGNGEIANGHTLLSTVRESYYTQSDDDDDDESDE